MGCFDVAVSGFWRCGHDAKGHQSAGFGGRASRGNGGAELLGVANQMVRRQHQQERVIAVGGGLQCGHGHRWSGVASHRLQQDRVGFNAQLAHLFRHDEAVVLIADQQGSRQSL